MASLPGCWMAASPTTANPYTVLGVGVQASAAEIKAAYRQLVKQHHPDAGGDAATIVALNAAWEVLGDRERRRLYDSSHSPAPGNGRAPSARAARVQTPAPDSRGAARDGELLVWLQRVYAPIDRLLGQVILAFPGELRALAADPYDDQLMEAFCAFLEQSKAKLEKVQTLYRSMACPSAAKGFGLSLYHCLSQVEDALAELERYTLGYVDSYLHDGREMLREAKRRRSLMKEERRRLDL
jgi:molecular chaperone DnaJ